MRFSVVVPAYNAESTLRDTLDAILAQSFADWECVVVNDGSIDGTRAVAAEYAQRDSRVAVLTQENAGTGGAYNTGVASARGAYIVLCSADDVLLREHLAELDAFIRENPGFDIYTTNGYLWTPESGSRTLVYQQGTVAGSWSLADLIDRCYFGVGAVYRRDLFGTVRGYRTDVFGEDYDFWLRATAAGARHRYLDKPLSLHRVSATQKSANLVRAYESDIRLVRDLRASFALSAEERDAVKRRIASARSIIRQIHREGRMNRVREAPALQPVRRVYRRIRRAGM